MYVVNGSDCPCILAVRLIVGVRYLGRPRNGDSTVYIFKMAECTCIKWACSCTRV